MKKAALAGTAALLLGLLICLLSAVLAGNERAGTSSVRVLRVGYAIEPPYAFLNAQGRVTGESPELARIAASELGFARVEFIVTNFDRLVRHLNDGRFDVIAAGLFITPQRTREVSFSVPTFQVGAGLLTQPGRVRVSRPSYEQLAHMPDLRLAVLAHSVEETQLLAAGFADSRLVRVPDARAGQILVETAVVDGLALSAPSIRWMTTHSSAGLECLELSPDTPRFRGGLAFRINDRSLRESVDQKLTLFLHSSPHIRLMSGFQFMPEELETDAR